MTENNRKFYERTMDKLDALRRDAMQRGDDELTKMISAEVVRLALQQHRGLQGARSCVANVAVTKNR